MKLTFSEFKKRLAAARAKSAAEKPRLLSQTQLRRLRRAQKTRSRAACDSFRYRQKHAVALTAHRKREQNARRAARKAEKLV